MVRLTAVGVLRSTGLACRVLAALISRRCCCYCCAFGQHGKQELGFGRGESCCCCTTIRSRSSRIGSDRIPAEIVDGRGKFYSGQGDGLLLLLLLLLLWMIHGGGAILTLRGRNMYGTYRTKGVALERHRVILGLNRKRNSTLRNIQMSVSVATQKLTNQKSKQNREQPTAAAAWGVWRAAHR